MRELKNIHKKGFVYNGSNKEIEKEFENLLDAELKEIKEKAASLIMDIELIRLGVLPVI